MLNEDETERVNGKDEEKFTSTGSFMHNDQEAKLSRVLLRSDEKFYWLEEKARAEAGKVNSGMILGKLFYRV